MSRLSLAFPSADKSLGDEENGWVGLFANSSLSACQTCPNRTAVPGRLHGRDGRMSKPPVLSLAQREGDGELTQSASPQQCSGTRGERERGICQRCAKVRVEGPSTFVSCNICTMSLLPGLHQHSPPLHSYQGNYINHLKNKNTSFFLQAFSSQ